MFGGGLASTCAAGEAAFLRPRGRQSLSAGRCGKSVSYPTSACAGGAVPVFTGSIDDLRCRDGQPFQTRKSRAFQLKKMVRATERQRTVFCTEIMRAERRVMMTSSTPPAARSVIKGGSIKRTTIAIADAASTRGPAVRLHLAIARSWRRSTESTGARSRAELTVAFEIGATNLHPARRSLVHTTRAVVEPL